MPSPAPKTVIDETGHSWFIDHPGNPGNGNIVHYFDNETLVFLYLDSKTKAVTYDTTNGIHRKIVGSASPNEHMDKILHVRLGKHSTDFFKISISAFISNWDKKSVLT